MENFSAGAQLLAIVVGSVPDEFVRHTKKLLNNYEIESVLCENIYSAVSELAKNRGRNILVFGRFEQLGREGGRFFEKTNEAGVFCCCLAERYLYEKRKQISHAENAGAAVVNNREEVEEVMAKSLTDRAVLPPAKKRSSNAANFNRNEFAATKEELSALLEA